MSKITFGEVVVADKKLSNTGNSFTVKLVQETYTTVSPLENNRFVLAHTTNKVETDRVVKSKRANNQTVSLEDGDKWEVGKVVPGHIQRITHPSPQWAGHKAAFEGGFATTQYHPQYEPDVDLR